MATLSMTPSFVASGDGCEGIDARTSEVLDMDFAKSSNAELTSTIGDSLAQFSVNDDEMLSSLFALDSNEGLEFLHCEGSSSNADPDLVERVRFALGNLPKDMQTLFVDRIVAVIGNPRAMEQQVQAMSDLAACAADEAHRRLVASGRSPSDKHCLRLASAVLGAYLTRYSAQEEHHHQQYSVQPLLYTDQPPMMQQQQMPTIEPTPLANIFH